MLTVASRNSVGCWLIRIRDAAARMLRNSSFQQILKEGGLSVLGNWKSFWFYNCSSTLFPSVTDPITLVATEGLSKSETKMWVHEARSAQVTCSESYGRSFFALFVFQHSIHVSDMYQTDETGRQTKPITSNWGSGMRLFWGIAASSDMTFCGGDIVRPELPCMLGLGTIPSMSNGLNAI